MGKITIKHYLNKSVKPRIEGNKELYPLYVQVIANRTNYRFKSNFPFNDGYLRESDLVTDFVISSNEAESKKLEIIINYLLESNKLDLLTAENIKIYSEILWDVINWNFGILFEKEGENLPASYPACLVSRCYFDIDETLKFTESEIETKFSEDYRYCKIGMDAIYWGMIDNEYQDLEIKKITVFDFLYGTGFERVLQAVKRNYGFHGGDEEKEYLKVLDEIKKLIFLQ